MRQPIEDQVVPSSMAQGSQTFAANLLLVAMMNSCPPGHRVLSEKVRWPFREAHALRIP